jgi:two-component system NtrC family response regulator
VLILGENGTGKELVAHAVHQSSHRREGPFIPIHCGAILETCSRSRLVTSAARYRCLPNSRRCSAAEGGTIFLDEIGELPVHLQVKLLRFLQDHVIERVGGREAIRVDVRVVAATNRDLKAAIAAGAFREDLFYRLSVLTIQVPPLRERGDDIRTLAEYFLEFYTRHHKRRIKGFTRSALRSIQAHPWPGNVRELENRVQRGVIMARDAYLRPEDLELAEPQVELPRTLQEARDQAERAAGRCLDAQCREHHPRRVTSM